MIFHCRYALLIIILFIAGGLVSCGGGSGGSGGDGSTLNSATSTEISNKTRLSESMNIESQQGVIYGINAFGIKWINQDSHNTVFSPYSASIALSALRLGSAGATKTDIENLMNLSASSGDIDAAFNALDLSLRNRLGPATLNGDKSAFAAGAWDQSRYGLMIQYLDALAENYGIWPVRTDFALQTATAAAAIGAWATAASGLNALLSITQDTRFATGQGIQLNTAWNEPFNPTLTEKGWFKTLYGTSVETNFMKKTGLMNQLQADTYAAFELPLQGDLRFLIVLPNEDQFSHIAALLTPAWIEGIVSSLTTASVNIAIPIFTIENQTSLSLGTGAIRDAADFSGIDGTKDLFISSSDHHSKIVLSEAGLKATALTLFALEDAHPETWPNSYSCEFMGVHDSFLIPPDISVILGRPFFFFVRDSATGVILFAGRFMAP